MRSSVVYGDMLGNTENRQIVALYIQIEKKKKFFAKQQTKAQKPVWKEETVVVMKLSPHKSNKHKQE